MNIKPRFDEDTGIYRDCTNCHGAGENGSGCPDCLRQRDAAYAAAFPDGAQPLATATIEDYHKFQKTAGYKILCAVKGSDYTFKKWALAEVTRQLKDIVDTERDRLEAARDAAKPRNRHVCQHCGAESFVPRANREERVKFPPKCHGRIPLFIETIAPA